MFESKLTAVLQKYLGDYVYGLDKDALKVSIWSGNLVLKNLKLKPESLKFLGIPGLVVKTGLLGSLTLRIPWNRLGSEPVIVEFDRIYVLASLDASGKSNLYDDVEQADEVTANARRRRIDAAVQQRMESRGGPGGEDSEKEGEKNDGGYINHLVQTIIGNLQIIITNLHVRIEDSYWGFSVALTIEEISGITINDKGEPEFVSSVKANERLRKRLKLRKLTLYIDPNSREMTSESPWEDLNILAWDNFFLPNIKAEDKDIQQTFFLRPVNAELIYDRSKGKDNETQQNIKLTFEEVGLNALQQQYLSIQRLLQTFEVVSARAPYSHIRPHCSVRASPRAWWVYAVNAFHSSGLVRKRISMSHLIGWNRKRKDYVDAYLEHLEAEAEAKSDEGESQALRNAEELEEDLHEKTIVFFRCLAIGEHKRREGQRKKAESGRGWFFGWGAPNKTEEDEDLNFGQTDWEKLEEIYLQDGSGDAGSSGPLGSTTYVDVEITSTSLRLQNGDTEVLLGNVKEVRVNAAFVSGLLSVTSSVESYLLQSQNLEIMKSGSIASNVHALDLTVKQSLDNDLHLTHVEASIAPCFVEISKSSIENIIVYFQAHDKGTRLTTLGMQAGAAAQELGKNTAEQLQVAIASRPLVTFSLDIQAPKVAIVWGDSPAMRTLIVNLGRIMLCSEDSDDEKVWQKVRLNLSDSEVYIADGELQWKNVDTATFSDCTCLDLPKSSLLDKFGMELLLQYGDLSSEDSELSLDLHVPELFLHFSPMVINNAMKLVQYYTSLSALLGSGDNWEDADLTDYVQIAILSEAPTTNEKLSPILSPKKRHNMTMNWIHSCKIFLQNDTLYADIPGSHLQRRIFLGNASQISTVPSRFVDNRENVIIITESEERLRRALNTDNSIVIAYDNEERKGLWLQHLQSRNQHLKGFGLKRSQSNEFSDEKQDVAQQQKSLSIHIDGKLDVFHLFVKGRAYNPAQKGYSIEPFFSFDTREETDLINVNAKGVSVAIDTSNAGMHLEAILNSLFVEDLLLGKEYDQCKFLIASETEQSPADVDEQIVTRVETLGTIDQEGDVFYDPDDVFATGSKDNSLAIIKFSSSSDEAAGNTTELDVNLSKISVYVNRPTIAALMVIGQDIGYYLGDGGEESSEAKVEEDLEMSTVLLPSNQEADTVVNKDVFTFKLQMKEAKFIFNYEMRKTPLAILAAESLSLNIDLSEGDFLLKASLGNLKVADCSVDSTHMYYWAVDIYESESGSLIDLTLGSVDKSEDITGADMFIDAHMNSISVVFLNKFLTEILLFIQNLFLYQPELLGGGPIQPEIDPEAKPLLLRLNVSLDAPMIKLPRSTASPDYLELTPGEVKVKNKFLIHPCGEKDIFVDEMEILLTGVKGTACMNGKRGTDILDDTVLKVILSRPLNFAENADNTLGVKVLSSETNAKLSKKEYHFVISVAGENFSEEMVFKPSFQLPLPEQETMIANQDPADDGLRGVSVNVSLSAVSVLMYGEGEKSPFASLKSKNLQTYLLVDFKDESLDITLSIPQIQVENVEKHTVVLCSGNSLAFSQPEESTLDPSLLFLRFRTKANHSELDLKLQEPRIFGENKFIMNMLDFFVPTVIPEDILQCTTIDDPNYKADCNVYLSPATRICAASSESDLFIYDGNGFSLVFPKDNFEREKVPLVYVATNKTLKICNTTIVNFSQMSSYTELMANAKIEFENVQYEDGEEVFTRTGSQAVANEETHMELSIQAHNFLFEFTLMNEDTSLSAQGNADVSFHIADKSQHLRTKVEDLFLFVREKSSMKSDFQIESDAHSAKNAITLLHPCTLGVDFVSEESSDMLHVNVSNLNFQVSPMTIQFLLQLQEEIMTSLGRAPPEKPLMRVLHFKRIVSLEVSPGTLLTFWRPICDSKYAIIGDCISFGDRPPTKNVSVVAKGYGMVKEPLDFECVITEENIKIWHPIAPEGYISLGCIASDGGKPDTSDVYCIHRSLTIQALTEEYFSPASSIYSIVNVRNHFGNFIVLSSTQECACLDVLAPSEIIEELPNQVPGTEQLSNDIGESQQDIYMDRKVTNLEKERSKPYLRYVVRFQRLMKNKGGNYSFWRPILPDDCYSLGDIAMDGLTPPAKALCIHKTAEDVIASPIKFSLVRIEGKISIWRPVAPDGYVAMGYLLSTSTDAPPIDSICCVKASYVAKPLTFNMVEIKTHKENLYVFTFDDILKTFIISESKTLPEEGYALNFEEEEEYDDGAEKKKRMIVTTKCGNIKLTVSDSVQTPKFEVQLVDILVSMEGKGEESTLMCTFGLSLSSYNSKLLSWESIVDKSELILKIKNSSSKFNSIALPKELGIDLSFTSPLHITIAHACLESALYLLSEWSDMARSGSLFVNQDLDCLNTTVTNEIGSDFYLRLKYNNGTEKIEKIGTGSQEVLQPFKTSLKLKNAKMLDLGDNYVRVTVESLSGSLSMEPNMLYMISATLQCKDQELSSCIATRFFCGFDEGDFHCDETLLLPLSPDMKCLLHGGDLAEDDILSVNLNLWQTAHSDTQTKELIATIAYPILKEPSSVIEESKYPFPFSDDTKATSGLFLTFALAFPKQKPRELAETNFESETYIGVTEEGPWMPLSSTKPIEMSNNTRNPMAKGGSGTISPFKMGASSIILESNLIAGRKLERFRSNVQVYNASQTSFDVGIKKVIPAELNVFEVEGDHDPVDGKYFVSVFENQRFNVTEGWKHSGGDNKRSKYSTFYGKCLSTKDFPNLPLPLGWEWCGEWTPRKVPHTDKKGWCYFKNFAKFQYPPPKASRSKGLTDNVRSRCFIRYCKHTTLTDEEIAVISLENNSIVEVGTVKQHEQLVIPKKFCAVGSILELVWRPSICLANTEDKVYNWSVLLSTGSEIMSLACMEETSQLMACAPNPLEGVEEEPLLFSATSEGVELSSYSQIVTDWRINIAPAVSIENCTGVNATVNLWEHQKGILPALRCKTTTLPHSTMENLKIDPRKMLSMALVPDGWEWEKGRNPIALESNKKEMKSSKLTLVKDKNYIILQMTKARVNPKFEFPYYVKVWSEYCIQNETGLPIQFCVVERDSDFEELTSSAIRTIVAEESSGHVQSLQKQTVMPGMSELFSGLRSSGNCGIQVAIKDSGWTVESIPLVPGGDIILVQAYCPYSSLVYSVTVSARLHDLAPTTIVTCKPHLVCSNFTGRIISVCRGQGMESTAQKVEVNGRGVEIHSADKGKMDLRLKVDGYLWSTALNVKYPNGPNTDLILESEDLTHARILSVKTRLESPGCLHIQFISFNLLEYSPPYSVVNFSSEILMYRQPNAEEALWTQIEPYTSCIPKLRYGDSSTRMDGGVKIELKANDAPSRIYTLYSDSSSEKDFSMDADEEDAEVQLDTKQDFGLNTKLVPLPIDAFPGECEAMLVRTNKHCRKLVISKIFKVEKTSRKGKHCFTPLHTEFNLTFAADYLDVSIVNSVPKEIALLTVKGLQFSLSDGVGISDDKIMTNLQIEDIEIDDMNPLSEYPVAIMCRKKNKPFLSLALHQMKSHLQPSLHVSYSDLLLRRPLEVEIHETLIWEFVSFLQSLSLDRLESRQDAYVDPDMQVDILSVAGLTAKINFMSDSSSRPKNLNFISKFGLKFANIENLSISILRKWEVRNLSVKQSVFMRLLFSRISRDVSKQILPILFSGLSLNTVSNVTTGAISSIANAAAVLSLDDKFEKDRDKKATHSKDLADGLASGGESLAKGVVSGITGIFTKPIEGAKKGGAKGFAKGFAKGILGAAAKPISGALDMVSKSVEGGLATIDGVKSIAEVSKKRLRYPRAITGNMILKPYNAFASQGQQIFKTSVIAGDVENLEFTKGLNPFTKDFYEYHEPLPSDRVVIVTDQRVLCIKVPKGSLEGGTILWHAHFLDILSLEIPDISSESPRILTIILSANMGSKFTFQKQKLQHEVHCYPKQNQAKRLFQVISEKRQSCMNALHKPDILLSVSDVEDEEDKDMPATVECSDFVLAWHSGDYKGENVYVWRPKCPPGYSMLGDMASYGTDKPPNPTMIVKDSSYQDEAWLAKPVSYKLEWRETKKGKSSPAAFWIPIPPEGYVALGCLAQTGNTEPSVDLIRCVKKSMVFETSIYDSSCWSGTSNDRQGWPLSLWQVDNSLHTFIPCRSKTKPVGLTGFDLMM